jgi:peptidoglycan-associated lipoprotein
MKFWSKIMIVVVPALLLIGCGTSGEVQDEGAGAPAADSGASATTSGVSGDSGAAMEATQDTMKEKAADELGELVSKRVVYFDFDRSDVKDEFSMIVSAHGKFLAANSNAKVTLEGHADERGTREYNIALGERRIAAVKRILTLEGASAGQIEAISYGEERPAALGHDEDAWALNRRVEFIYMQ